ncbi:DNA-binding protein inhibitor ID-2 [Halocaridina rubra]|uniref:DNA-binding protein inhibitor ID-2 n=1 Tax=Halocaridina rubra TaxID=373956 RepID=A0AAN8WCK3_HALRR
MRVQRCVSPVHAVMGVMEGKIQKAAPKPDCADVLLYLERLQNLVPMCPKDRPVSKLELIQSVIDYIYDLEDALVDEEEEEEDDFGVSPSDEEMDFTLSNVNYS